MLLTAGFAAAFLRLASIHVRPSKYRVLGVQYYISSMPFRHGRRSQHRQQIFLVIALKRRHRQGLEKTLPGYLSAIFP